MSQYIACEGCGERIMRVSDDVLSVLEESDGAYVSTNMHDVEGADRVRCHVEP